MIYIAVLSCVKYTAKNLTPKGFPPPPAPLIGGGKGRMFLAGRGVRIKASLAKKVIRFPLLVGEG
jgi:hypothetical protein